MSPVPDALATPHRFVGGDPALPTLLLLHGTGGSEDDLLPLGRAVLPGAALLSPRGTVLEHGQARFFRRLAAGVFDQDDLRARTDDLAAFIAEAAAHYGIDPRRVVALGFSNGANIAASLLLRGTGRLAGAVLLRPMVPFEPDQLPDLTGVPVLLAAGRMDPMVPAPLTERLAALLGAAGASVETVWHPGGHGLVQGDVTASSAFLQGVVGRKFGVSSLSDGRGLGE